MAAITLSTSGWAATSTRADHDLGAQPAHAQARAQPGRRRVVGDDGHLRPEGVALRQQFVDAPLRAECENAVTIRVARHHVQRADADGAGGAEDGKALHGGRA
jgi:hypothetical protein